MSIVLRPLERCDSAQVLAWRNSEAVAPYVYGDHRIGVVEHRRWIEATLGSDAKRYWIVEWDERPVGLAKVVGIDRDRSRCEWAYYLADPDIRDHGVGACVEYIVLRHVFERLELNKLWCEVLIHNEAVWRLHESFGLRREADLRAHVRKAGALVDVVGFGLLRSEWPQVKAAAEARLQSRGIDLGDLVVRDSPRPPIRVYRPVEPTERRLAS